MSYDRFKALCRKTEKDEGYIYFLFDRSKTKTEGKY